MASAGSVLIVVQNLPVPFDRRVWLEARALRDAGYEVSVISPAGRGGTHPAGTFDLERIRVYRYPPPPEATTTLGYIFEFAYCWLWTLVLTIRAWAFRPVDVFHACNPPETFFLVALPLKVLGTRFVFDHHDLSPEMYVAKGGRPGGLLHRGLLWLERATFRAADVVVTTNQSHRAVAKNRGGIPDDRVFVVRSGPDFERLIPVDPEPILKRGREHLVCYLGEMCKQDGVDYLLRAIRQIIDRGRRDITFVLIGGGPELAELQSLAGRLELDEYVFFTGRASDEDLCRYLSTADVCVDPDPFTEWADQSTMNKIMEYMAFSKPIVAFDLREHRESAQTSAVYVPPNDVGQFGRAIERLIEDPDARAEMGEAGRRRVENELAWDYSIPPLLKAYARALQSEGLTHPRP